MIEKWTCIPKVDLVNTTYDSASNMQVKIHPRSISSDEINKLESDVVDDGVPANTSSRPSTSGGDRESVLGRKHKKS